MELKEFINNTLTQMAEGVQEAIDGANGKSYLVNPSMGKVGATCTVHFDLSVESGKEGTASIKVLGGSVQERSLNRITFDININLPCSGTSAPAKHPSYTQDEP